MTHNFLRLALPILLIADLFVIVFFTHRLAPFLVTFVPELAAGGSELPAYIAAFFCAVVVSGLLFLAPYLTATQDRRINIHDIMDENGVLQGSSLYLYMMSIIGWLIAAGLELFVFYTNTMERLENPYNTDPTTWGDIASAFLVAMFFTIVHIVAAAFTAFSYAYRQQETVLAE